MKKIGKTTYKARVHFSTTSTETMSDKIKRMLKNEVQQMEKFSRCHNLWIFHAGFQKTLSPVSKTSAFASMAARRMGGHSHHGFVFLKYLLLLELEPIPKSGAQRK